MNKTKIGIFLSLLLLIGLTSCGEKKSNSKLVLNEVLIDNQSNFQDDYGLHSVRLNTCRHRRKCGLTPHADWRKPVASSGGARR